MKGRGQKGLKIPSSGSQQIKKYWKNPIIVVILRSFLTGNQEKKGTEINYVK
jgi:hypothetical protein